MQTNIDPKFKHHPQAQEAESIIRACVHCGFCTATCPTYQLLGDELDGPRGRIYLIKQLLEGATVSTQTQVHLDRCLTCRACETTCPSGVRYGRLAEIGRSILEQQVGRRPLATLVRFLLRKIIPYPKRLAVLVISGLWLKPLLPARLRQKVPKRQTPHAWPQTQHPRNMLILKGCAQAVVSAHTNTACASVLDHLGITLMAAPKAGCCGAVSHHLSQEAEGLAFMRRNIDAWWPYIETHNIEAIITAASGCGVLVKEYGDLLQHDPHYAEKAKRVAALAKDMSEVLRTEQFVQKCPQPSQPIPQKIAFHSPCTLQHGQQLNGVVESILSGIGYTLLPVAEAHLCCGSAGTYSILQATLSQQLLDRKLTHLQQAQPDIIATANIGCQMHLATQAHIPVKHWIELVAEVITTHAKEPHDASSHHS